jgi:UDP-N-acetylglucosamine--N-acetylmuramyl-(pentapeptide) pyrophosphoryl-undecaprenol N-acetylglucosamine transferase
MTNTQTETLLRSPAGGGRPRAERPLAVESLGAEDAAPKSAAPARPSRSLRAATTTQTLLVASAGGHLDELWLLRSRLSGITDDVTWVTSDTPQSRALLDGERRIFVPWAAPRDVLATLSNTRQAQRVLASGRWSQVISTGSLHAVPFMALARARGIPCHFIDSATRVDGPSVSARLLERVPGVRLYSQYEGWDRQGWSYRGSVFDGFAPQDRPTQPLRRVVVALGANRYGFRRLIDAVRAALPRSASVLFQTGTTDVSDVPDEPGVTWQPFVSGDALFDAMRQADLVVAHAGVGTALTAMRAGHAPVLVARRAAHDEHVDDHQLQVVAALEGAGLAVATTADTLSRALLRTATARRVVATDAPGSFVLAS